MCYEIAKVLGYRCARIELAIDEYGNIGVLNYLFINKNEMEHDDAISYINKDEQEIVNKIIEENNLKISTQFLFTKNKIYQFLNYIWQFPYVARCLQTVCENQICPDFRVPNIYSFMS